MKIKQANWKENKLHVSRVRENRKKIIKGNKLISKLQQRFRSEKHNAFTEEVNKTVLNAKNDKRIQSVDSLETYVYWTNEEIIHSKKEIKCNTIQY